MPRKAAAVAPEPDDSRPRRRRANNEGTVYQRKDGRWAGAAFVTDTSGKRIRVPVYGRTREEAHNKVLDLLANDRKGKPVAATGQRVGEYLTYWLEQVARHQVRPSTYKSYELYVSQHLVPGLGRKQLAKLSAKDVRTFLNAKREEVRANGRKLSPRTVFHLHAVLRNALEHAVRDDLLPRNVARQVRVSPGHQEEVKPLTVDEAKTLLKYLRDDRLYALYAVALSLGLRRGEALGLRWADVDLTCGRCGGSLVEPSHDARCAGSDESTAPDTGVLRVRQTLQKVDGQLVAAPPKTRRSARTLPLPPALVAVLYEHHVRQQCERKRAASWSAGELVFTTAAGDPLQPNAFSKMFERACGKAGIRRVRLHDLRHTCASLLLAQQVPPRVVMEIMGHSSLDVTMMIYGHVMLEAHRDALGGMNDLLDE